MIGFLGSVAGVAIAGPMADRFGRRGGMVCQTFNKPLALLNIYHSLWEV